LHPHLILQRAWRHGKPCIGIEHLATRLSGRTEQEARDHADESAKHGITKGSDRELREPA